LKASFYLSPKGKQAFSGKSCFIKGGMIFNKNKFTGKNYSSQVLSGVFEELY